MKYTCEIEIDVPRSRVIELFDDADNRPKWQPGLVSFAPQSGEPGQVGAKSRLRHKMGKRDLEMIETVTRRNPPDELACTYEVKGMWNEVANVFEELGKDKTRWLCHSEFRGLNLMMKTMLTVSPGLFKKETVKYMTNFKTFAEAEG